jgi:hypothetical protein
VSEPIKYEPEVVSINAQGRRILVYPENWGGERKNTTIHFIRVSDGEVFYLTPDDVKKLVRAFRDWGYIES